MAIPYIQTSFAAGELSPSLYGRVDLAKWHIGAATMRNFFVNYRGGASSRAGTAYIGMTKQNAPNAGGVSSNGQMNPPRDIRFQFNETQGYALEFGHQYMRVKFQGGYVTELYPVSLATTTGLSTATVSSTAGLALDQLIVSQNINGGQALITNISGNTITFSGGSVTAGITGTDPNAFAVPWIGGCFVAGGICTLYIYGILPVVGDWFYFPNASVPELNNKVVVVTGVVGGPNPTTVNFTDLWGNSIVPASPPGVGNVGFAQRIYTVTAPYADVDTPWIKFTQSADTMSLTCRNQATGTQYPPYDLVRNRSTSWVFTQTNFGAVIAAPSFCYATAQSSTTTDTWYSYVVTAVDAATGQESNPSPAAAVKNNDIAVHAGSNTINWAAVAKAKSYNIYAATPSYNQQVQEGVAYGYIGSAVGTNFTDTNITPDFTTSPPIHTNPFAPGTITGVTITQPGANLSQSAISYAISTTTGSGFLGVPVVANGGLAGFVIEAGGQNYAASDTIAIGPAATGTVTFTPSTNPANASSVFINGNTINFKSAPGTNEVQIGATLAQTLQNFANLAATNPSGAFTGVAVAVDASHIYFTSTTPGGTANTYSASAGTSATPTATTNFTITGSPIPSAGAATLTIGPSTGTYPSTVAYFQQRRVYANSANDPDTYWMSQPGAYTNMDSSVPVGDADAITGTPWSQQVNGIQHMVMMPSGLVVLTGNGAWQVQGANGAAITPANQSAAPQAYNGISALVPPFVNNYDIIYLQSKGSIFRDLAYNFFVNVYTGTDLTVLANHLFTNFTFTQVAWCEEPYKLMWAVRNDGALLSFTYLKEQDVFGWARHDTNGLVQGVCSVTEPPVDALYLIVKRFINGTWVYYSERMDNRVWNAVEDCWCVDAGLASPMNTPNATLTASAVSGTVTLTASPGVFSGAAGSGRAGDVIRAGGGIFTVVMFASATQVVCSTVQPITQTVPNDPNNAPAPVAAGSWSIAAPTTTVSGLSHLNGMTVTGLADGNVIPPTMVSNGQITLGLPASKIVVGLPFTAQLQSLYLEPPGPVTAQGRRKAIYAVTARVEASRGFSVGTNQPDAAAQPYGAAVPWGRRTPMIEWKQRAPGVLAGQPIPLFTGDVRIGVPSDWQTGGQAAIQQTYPLPVSVLALIPEYQIGDTPG